MIMTYIKMVAAVIMLGQPAGHAVDSDHAEKAITIIRSSQISSKTASRPAKATRHAANARQSKSAARVRAAKNAKPTAGDAPPTRIADLQSLAKPAAKANVNADGRPAIDTRTVPVGIAVSAPTIAAAAATTSDSSSDTSNSDPRTTQQQVMVAMTAAELSTTFRTVGQPDRKTADADRLVAIVMARPDVKSVSDLAGKNVAIDSRQLNGNVRTAIAAAGATAVQLSENQTKAIDRLIGGEVPAAVLTLVSPEAGERFPEIEGYRIFRIPLSPL